MPPTQLQGQSLALSFKPSSSVDENALASLLPQPHADGSPITAAELPTTLPSTIRMTPEITLGGQLLRSVGSFKLGSELAIDMGYVSPSNAANSTTSSLSSKTIRAGEYHAIGYDLQGLSPKQLQALKTQLEQAKTTIDSQQPAQLATLSKHDLTGAMLQAGVQSYFALNDSQDRIAQSQSNIVQYHLVRGCGGSAHGSANDRNSTTA